MRTAAEQEALDDQLPASQARVRALETRLRRVEKQLDTLGTPWWRRWWFRLDGWPPWWVVANKRARRPWHSGEEGMRIKVMATLLALMIFGWFVGCEAITNATAPRPVLATVPAASAIFPLRVTDLDGRVTGNWRDWTVMVEAEVVDANDDLVTGATVEFFWFNWHPSNITCVTGADGRCSAGFANLRTRWPPLSDQLHVQPVRVCTSAMTATECYYRTHYDWQSNTDSDGDTNGYDVFLVQPTKPGGKH